MEPPLLAWEVTADPKAIVAPVATATATAGYRYLRVNSILASDYLLSSSCHGLL